MTKPKPSESLRWRVMSKDSWSRALGIGRRGSLGEPFTSTGAISRASSSVASEDEQKTHANVFGANVFVFVCVGVRIPEGFCKGFWSVMCVHVKENMQISGSSNGITYTMPQCSRAIYRLWMLKAVASGDR